MMTPETEEILRNTISNLTRENLTLYDIKDYVIKIYNTGFDDGREHILGVNDKLKIKND